MVDCKVTTNFFKEYDRMCNSHVLCGVCPVNIAKGDERCSVFVRCNLEKAIEIVQKWSDEHPQKTLLEDLKEKYPNYQRSSTGTPSICPYKLGYEESEKCPAVDTCAECWSRPLDEVLKK